MKASQMSLSAVIPRKVEAVTGQLGTVISLLYRSSGTCVVEFVRIPWGLPGIQRRAGALVPQQDWSMDRRVEILDMDQTLAKSCGTMEVSVTTSPIDWNRPASGLWAMMQFGKTMVIAHKLVVR